MKHSGSTKRVVTLFLTWILVGSGCLGLFSFFDGFTGGAGAIVVPVDYPTIQSGIENATHGDIVRVWAGTYNENIVINKTLTIIGNGTADTVINVTGIGDAICITSEWVNITGFTATGSGYFYDNAGIKIKNSNYCRIENCNSTYNNIGILLENSSYITVANNSVYMNHGAGISLDRSDFNIISNNTVDSNRGETVNNAGLVGHWKMDEPSWNGTPDEVVDSSGLGNHGTAHNGADTTSESMMGRAGEFDGWFGYVEVPHNTSLDISGDFTVEAWIKAKGINKYLSVVDKYDGSKTGSNGTSFYLVEGFLRFSLYNGSDAGGAQGTTDLRDNKWHHVAGTFGEYDGLNHFVRVYVDGKLEGKNTVSFTPGSTPNNLGIGKRLYGWGGTMEFEGLMDELRIYNRFYYPHWAGINLLLSHNNTLSLNTVGSNGHNGIALYSSDDCEIYNNTISNNQAFGIYILGSSTDNTVFDNIFRYNNGAGYDIHDPLHIQAYDGMAGNYWNSSAGRGNLWYDWLRPDSDGDGIVDNPYEIHGSAVYDHYPLSPLPSAPRNLRSYAGVGCVNLTWDVPQYEGGYLGYSITNYKIYRGTAIGGETLLTATGTNLFYNDSTLTSGWTYYYTVSAVNDFGEGGQSDETNATPLGVPFVPENLLAVAGDCRINITWGPPDNNGGSPITGYNIYRNGTAGVYGTVPAGQLWFYDDAVTNGLEYTYNVAAVNVIGEGPDTSDSATPMTVPSAPQDLQVIVENGCINITWSPPAEDGGSAITEFHIYRDGTGAVYETVLATVMSYDDHDVMDGATYTYYVSAGNEVGEGPLSSEASATAGSYPSEPTELNIEAGDGWLNISWNPPISYGGYPVTNYTVYRGTSSGDETQYALPGNGLFLNDTAVLNGVTYLYRISATNPIGEGPLSNAIPATPHSPENPVNQPPTSAISSPLDGATVKGIIEITGTSSDSDGSVLRVEIRIDGGNWITVSGTSSWNHTYDTTELSDGQHKITVRSFDGEDHSAESSVTVTVVNPEEEPYPIWLPILILVIVAVLIPILIFSFRKRKDVEDAEIPEGKDIENPEG